MAGNTYSYSWNTVPVQTTQTATGLCAGSYVCIVSDANGCSPSPAISVTITEPAAVTIAPIADITICTSGSTPLNATVTGGTGGYSYSWSPGAGLINDSISNPVAAPTANTTYVLTVTDGNSCSGSTTATVNVNPPLALITAGAGSICPGGSAAVSATASAGNGGTYFYSWLPVSGLSDPSVNNPTATPGSTTTYTVTVADNCSPAVTSTVTVTVEPLAVPLFTSTVLSGCAPVCVDFTDNSTISSGTVTGWSWNFGGDGTGSGQAVSHCFVNAGTYPITLTDTSLAGCISTSTMVYNITVNPVPEAAYSAPMSTSIFTPHIEFTDESTISSGTITSWQWNFGDPKPPIHNTSTLQNPTHGFGKPGTYCTQLIVTSNAGCKDTANLCIYLNPEFSFYVPNAFSPNHDGVNDEFYAKGEGIKKFVMYLYDRWGNEMAHLDDINKHWDGRANYGENVAQIDVYIWKVELIDVFDVPHSYTGTVTIVK